MAEREVFAADTAFFAALLAADINQLGSLLSDDFILVDVFSGSVIDKPALLGVLGASQLVFESIEHIESTARIYGATAVIVGRTAMSGSFAGAPFAAKSRYTHVFVEQGGAWRFVSAQGTQIVE